MSRKAVVIIAGLILVAVLWSGFWLAVRAGIENRIDHELTRLADRGIEVKLSDRSSGGFPFTIRHSVGHLEVKRPAAGWRYEGGPAAIAIDAWSPLAVRLSLPRKGEVTLAEGNGANRYEVTAADAAGIVSFGWDQRPEDAFLELAGVAVGKPGSTSGLAIDALVAEAKTVEDSVNVTLDASLPATGTSEMPGLAEPQDWRMRMQITSAANLTGRSTAALARWRDAGGKVVIDEIRVERPTSSVSVSGDVALDEALKPLGTLDAALTGYEALLDEAERSGRLPPDQARAWKQLLGNMAQAGSDGSKALSIVLGLREGRAFIGPFPVAELPSLGRQ